MLAAPMYNLQLDELRNEASVGITSLVTSARALQQLRDLSIESPEKKAFASYFLFCVKFFVSVFADVLGSN